MSQAVSLFQSLPAFALISYFSSHHKARRRSAFDKTQLYLGIIVALHSLPYAIFSPLFLLPLRSPLPEARQPPLSVLL